MKLLLDGVFNHAGAQWAPFVDAVEKGAASKYRDWFYFDGDGYETFATNIPSMPKLRTAAPDLRDLVLSVGRFWVQEYGVDGWRLDVAHEVDHALWRRFRIAVRDVDPTAFLVGETWDWALPWLRGDQFDSFMNYPLRRALLGYAATGDGPSFLDAVDAQRAQYPEPVHHQLFNLLASHDVERPMHVLAGSADKAALAAALMFTLPGVAAIYYGDEVGMTGGKEPANRGGMVWDAQRQDARMLALYRALGALRKRQPALRIGAYERLDESGGMVAFARGVGGNRVVVAGNPAASRSAIGAARLSEWLGGRAKMVATFGYAAADGSLGPNGLIVPSQSVVVIGRTEDKESE